MKILCKSAHAIKIASLKKVLLGCLRGPEVISNWICICPARTHIRSFCTYVKATNEIYWSNKTIRNKEFDAQAGAHSSELPAQAFEAGMRKYDHDDDEQQCSKAPRPCRDKKNSAVRILYAALPGGFESGRPGRGFKVMRWRVRSAIAPRHLVKIKPLKAMK